MAITSKILWVIAMLLASYGGLEAYFGLDQAENVMQQLASASIGMAWAIIPYCLARAFSELAKN